MGDLFDSGVLDPDVHARLVADIENVARDANILVDWISRPLGDVCSPFEVFWMKRFKFHRGEGVSGLCYVGNNTGPPVEDRMAALAGALTRNFIRARVMTLNAVIDATTGDDAPEMSCLLIPNFFIEKAQGGSLPAWRVSVLLDLLMHRQSLGLQTVISVSDMNAFGAEYGRALRQHVEAHFLIAES